MQTTMLKKLCFIFLVTCCSLFNKTNGQDDDCVPSVVSISIASNATLWWDLDPNRPCDITSFEVDIVGDKEDEYHFTVTETYVDLPFLPICERWHFTVTPISNDVVGFPHSMTSYVPLPPDADLTLSYFNFNYSGTADIILAWDLLDQTYGDCSLEYRLMIEDLDQGIIIDVYLEGKTAFIRSPSPCVTYSMDLRAINQAHPTIEGPLKRLYLLLNPRAQVAPRLRSIEIQATTVDMTWYLEGNNNRCPLRNFHIDGGVHFNTSVSLQDSEDPSIASVKITSLRPDSMYFMRALVENSGGISQGAPIGVQTLELSPD